MQCGSMVVFEGSSTLVDRKEVTVFVLRANVPICGSPGIQSWASTVVSALSEWMKSFCPHPEGVFFWSQPVWPMSSFSLKMPSIPRTLELGFPFCTPHPPALLQLQYQFGCDHSLSSTPSEHHYCQDIPVATPVSLLTCFLSPEEVNHHQCRVPVTCLGED